MASHLSLRTTAAVVLAFAIAKAYLESAVVVYLQLALGGEVGAIFPLRPAFRVGSLVAIEVGREAATLVMIWAVGALVGRTKVERLAWSAVVFGAWDIGYYAWLNVLSGWPPTLDTTDLLFLISVPWVDPAWSPVTLSVALIGVGLAAARRERTGPSWTLPADTGRPGWPAEPSSSLRTRSIPGGSSMASSPGRTHGRSSWSGCCSRWRRRSMPCAARAPGPG